MIAHWSSNQRKNALVCVQSHIAKVSHASESGPPHPDMSHTDPGPEDRRAKLVNVPSLSSPWQGIVLEQNHTLGTNSSTSGSTYASSRFAYFSMSENRLSLKVCLASNG